LAAVGPSKLSSNPSESHKRVAMVVCRSIWFGFTGTSMRLGIVVEIGIRPKEEAIGLHFNRVV